MNIDQDKISRIPEIILKELNREASPEEMGILNDWLSKAEENKALFQKLKQKDNLAWMVQEYNKINSQNAWGKVLKRIHPQEKRRMKPFFLKTIQYAAIFLALISVAAYLFFQKGTNPNSNTSLFQDLEMQISQLQESSLILADGEIINLQTNPKASIVETDGTQISKNDSTLLYQKDRKKEADAVQYNSLITPKSKVYSVILADGTKVWLNASSAIKYPTRFTSNIRKIYLTGEAYLEVTRDTTKPFIVSTNKMEIEVHGTSFNVMAYPEEKVVETTLVSGEVKVTTSKSKLTLKPGMQAQLNKETKSLAQFQTNTARIVSWRFGKYIFEYENLESVMTKLSRWYNVEVSFTDKEKKNLHFSGTLYKYNDINETLHIIELATDVKFKNSGDFITVN